MKELYYYLRAVLPQQVGFRGSNGQKGRWTTWVPVRVATVCIVTRINERGFHETARGVALCSPKDQFYKKIGRAIAKGRALHALKTMNYADCLPWPYPGNRPNEAVFKADYMPIWTQMELDLIRRHLPEANRGIVPDVEKFRQFASTVKWGVHATPEDSKNGLPAAAAVD